MSAGALRAELPQACRLSQVHVEAADIFTWTIAPIDAKASSYQPGQFSMLYLFGHGEVAVSLSGDPIQDARHGQMTHTIRAVGSVTRAMQALRPGDAIGVRGPFGQGWPVDEARGHDLLIIAGGLGLAPLRSLIEWVIHHRPDYGHIHILYGARSPADLLYRDDLQRWDGYQNINVMVSVDTADTAWRGHVGSVTELMALTGLEPDTTLAFVCGPEVMMRFTLLALSQQGIGLEQTWLAMERHMQCAVGYCGHCLYGPHFICHEGPVFRSDLFENLLPVREL